VAKKSQIDRAIEELENRKAALGAKYNTEANAIDEAIKVLKGQRRVTKPRAVKASEAIAG
jgi:hypothetical protein